MISRLLLFMLLSLSHPALALECKPMNDDARKGFMPDAHIAFDAAKNSVEVIVLTGPVSGPIVFEECSGGREFRCSAKTRWNAMNNVVAKFQSVTAFIVGEKNADLYAGHTGWHIVRLTAWIDVGSGTASDGSFTLDFDALSRRARVNELDEAAANYDCK